MSHSLITFSELYFLEFFFFRQIKQPSTEVVGSNNLLRFDFSALEEESACDDELSIDASFSAFRFRINRSRCCLFPMVTSHRLILNILYLFATSSSLTLDACVNLVQLILVMAVNSSCSAVLPQITQR